MTDNEAAAKVADAIRAGQPLGALAGVKIAVKTVLEKRDAVTKQLTERITIEDDGTKTVETFPQP